MKKVTQIKRRGIGFLLACAVLLSVWPGGFTESLQAADTQNVSVRIFNLEGDGSQNEQTEFQAEAPVNAAANLVVSGDGVKIENPWLVLRVEKNEGKAAKPQFVDSQNAYLSKYLEDETHYYMVYKLNAIAGGTNITFPFPFKFIGGKAETGDRVTVDFQMLQGDGEDRTNVTLADLQGKEVLYSTQKIYTAKADWLEINDSHINMWYASGYDKAKEAFFYHARNIPENQKTTGETEVTVFPMFSETVTEPEDLTERVDYRRPKNIKMQFKMPPYGELTEHAKRAGWTYDETTRIATFFRENPDISYVREGWREGKVGITSWGEFISMVNAPFFDETGDPQIYTIEASYIVNAGLSDERRLPDQKASYYLIPVYFKPGGEFSIWKDNLTGAGTTENGISYDISEGDYTYYGKKLYDRKQEQTAEGLIYTLDVRNSNNGESAQNPDNGQTTKVWSITDNLISRGDTGRLYYKYFTVAKVMDYSPRLSEERKAEIRNAMIEAINAPNKLYGIRADGTKELIRENIKYQEKVAIEDTQARYLKLELELSRPIELNNSAVRIITQAYPTKEEEKKFQDGTYALRQYYYGDASASVVTSRLGEGMDTAEKDRSLVKGNDYWARTGIGIINPKVEITNTENQSVAYSASGSFLKYSTQVYAQYNRGNWGPLANEPLEHVKVIQLLPPAFEYDSTTGTYGYLDKIEAPQVVENFKNTGRTAVIYTIPHMDPSDYRYNSARIETKIRALPSANAGNNKIESFMVYGNNDVILPQDKENEYTDVLDLNENGNVDEMLAATSSYINYIPPYELLVKKQVGYDRNNFTLFATGDLGYSFYYKINIFNNTIANVQNAYIIDVLPYKGDHYIVANDQGEYLDRASQFSTKLVQSLESLPENQAALEKFDVFYQVAAQGKDLESVRDGQWLTAAQIQEFSQVKSVKFVLKKGVQMESKSEVDFFLCCRMPYDKTLTPGEVAINSSAIATDGKTYSEGNSVKVTYEKYGVEGVLFDDTDEDGVMDETEERIAGRRIEVVDSATKEVAKDPKGVPLTAVTDEKGHYQIEVFKRGDYRIRFAKETYEIFTEVNGTANNQSNVETVSGQRGDSYGFSLNPISKSAVRNAGIIPQAREVSIRKISTETGDNKEEIPLSGVEFRLMQGEKLIATQVTDEKGEAVFSTVPFGEYTLVESKGIEGYEILEPKGRKIQVTKEKPVEVQVFENRPIRRDIRLTKADQDEKGRKLPGVTFAIYGKGETDKPIAEATSDEKGEVLFRDIPYGDYEIREIQTIEGYVQKEDSLEVSVKENKETAIDLGTVTNRKIKGTVKIYKQDGEKHPLSGAEFTLLQDGKEVKRQITDHAGMAVFADLVYGTYEVVESKAPEGYQKEEQRYRFEIREDGKTLEQTVVNRKLPEPEKKDATRGTSKVKRAAKTGDAAAPARSAIWLLVSGLGMLGIVGTSLRRKNR